MKIFSINKEEKLIRFKELDFKVNNIEKDLEILLEKNPDYFFENKILIIGRQVLTNFNTFIDLIGVDKNGDTVVIELKRDRTPRETIAQILEYASFVENLNYDQLNDIFYDYNGEGLTLEEYHKQYFIQEDNLQVSFNKNTQMLIVAQEISPEIKQTSLFLRQKGMDINCIEFRYFESNTGEKIFASDVVIGEDDYKKQNIKSASLPKVTYNEFIESLDDNGKIVFNQIFKFANENSLNIIWGSKGFSLNMFLNEKNIALLFGYPPKSVFKQSIYSGFEEIKKKIENSEMIIEYFKKELMNTGLFVNAQSNVKWIINKRISDSEVKLLLDTVKSVIVKVKSNFAIGQSNGT